MSTTLRPRSALAGLTIAALLLAGCGSDDGGDDAPATTEGSTAEQELQIADVWARQSPMGTTAGAIYLELTSPVDDELIAASVPTSVAGTTEIHETTIGDEPLGGEDDMGDDAVDDGAGMGEGDMGGEDLGGEGMGSMTMREIGSLELPAGETVVLEPGGYHVMLLDLVEPLEIGQTIDLTLTFEQAGERTVVAEVREG